ncbi:diguanylate cyclase [bacterium]|nr:diguanylate cyclase [bacterium]
MKKIFYILGLLLFAFLAVGVFRNANLSTFVDMVENRTFDLRQNITIKSGSKVKDDNIAIIAIDDASYEYILGKYGEWPLPRDIYAKIINYLEQKNPKVIAFDLMFVNSMKSLKNADEELTKSIISNNNVYTALNFDNQPEELRFPPNLPDNLSVQVKNNSSIDFSDNTFSNCRSILTSILTGTSNIGIINVSRADDGVLRKMPLFVKYQDKFYPQLALKVYEKYSGSEQKEYTINSDNSVIINNKKIKLDKDGNVLLNWYGDSGTYDYIPIYQLIKAVNGEGHVNYDFTGKVIYFGTTAASLFDIKTVPTSRIYPGVEIQATYVNNLLDNNFIIKISRSYVFVISILLALLIIFVVMKCSSIFASIVLSLSIYTLYLASTYLLMEKYNIWIEIIYPLIFTILAIIFGYIVKYIIKSRDFDTQYKLATTDGLTELFNHRYFQEQMKFHVEQAKRYGQDLSLIIIDIDLFKQFNDTYGHQVGDIVLRFVAQILKRNVRTTDIVCRYGGEEMSIILPNTGLNEAIFTAQKLCKAVAEKKVKISGKELGVTISLGVSSYPLHGETPQALISFADEKLYLAKNSGRNKVGNI